MLNQLSLQYNRFRTKTIIIVEQKEDIPFQLDSLKDVVEVEEISDVATRMLTNLVDYKLGVGLGFDAVGDLIYLIGASKNDVTASLYLRSIGISTELFSTPTESVLAPLVLKLLEEELIVSANPVGQGGLWVALVSASLQNTLGFSIKTDPSFRKDAFLFGESSERVVVSVKSDNQLDFEEALSAQHIPAKFLGVVSKGKMAIDSEKIMDVTEAKTLLGV